MSSINNNLITDIKLFIIEHKALCILTLGAAIVGYSIGNLAGRAVFWLRQCWGTTEKADLIARKSISSSGDPQQGSLSEVSSSETTVKDRNKTNSNVETLKALKRFIFRGQKISGVAGGVKMTGEEHIGAILYDKLIDQDKRTNCAIILKPFGNQLLPDNFDADSLPRYLIIPMSVNNNMHNTVLIIDNENQEYAYFDSLNGSIPAEALIECKAKKAIKELYKEVDTSSKRTRQNDGWSCGFHAVENAIAFVNGVEPTNRNPLGITLREKYAPAFERFANTHGTSENIFNNERLCRRQKIRLRDALADLNACMEDHRLYQLWNELCQELSPDSIYRERPITAFIDFYIQKYPIDVQAGKVLASVIDPRSLIYEYMPKSTDETNEDAKRQETIISEAIQALSEV